MGGETSLWGFPFPLGLISTAFKNFEYPWAVLTTMLILSGLLNVFQFLVLLRVKHRYRCGCCAAATAPAAGTPAATQNSATGTATTEFQATPTALTQTSVTNIAANPGSQPVPVSVPSYRRNKTKRAGREGLPGASQEGEPKVTTQSISRIEVQEISKDYSCHEGEQLVTWLLHPHAGIMELMVWS